MEDRVCQCLKLINHRLWVLDQQLLPQEETWVEIKSVGEMIVAIKRLAIRGAPAIGVAAALTLGLEAQRGKNYTELKNDALELRKARPTAVNLMWAMDTLILNKTEKEFSTEQFIKETLNFFDEDRLLCQKIAENGAVLVKDGDQILTHCNTGELVTAGVGTALGIISKAHKEGKNIHVYIDETRPLLQGGRLTAWECLKQGIPHTLICDNMAATLMNQKKINRVFVGADRVACNGDFANKIGTYNVAVCAKFHDVPFHPAAPYTTIDAQCVDGLQIPIELRKKEEVMGVQGHFGEVLWAPKDCSTYNPAFDVTPNSLITSFVFDHGVYRKEELIEGKHVEKSRLNQ